MGTPTRSPPYAFSRSWKRNWHDVGRLLGLERATSVSIVMLPSLDEAICMWLLLACRFSWSLNEGSFSIRRIPYSLFFLGISRVSIRYATYILSSSILWCADNDENGVSREGAEMKIGWWDGRQARLGGTHWTPKRKSASQLIRSAIHSAGGSSKGRVAAPIRT